MKAIRILAACLLAAAAVYYLIPSSHQIRNAVPSGDTIVCFGDSLTYGTGAAEGMDYPAQLARRVGLAIINAGVPGETTTGALRRIDAINALNPRIVLLTLGGNDLKNGVGKETAFQNLEVIVSRLQDKGALVVIGGLELPFWGRGYGAAYEELAEKTGSLLVPNVLEDILGRPDLMSDRIHPNSKGYGLMADHFYQVVGPYL